MRTTLSRLLAILLLSTLAGSAGAVVVKQSPGELTPLQRALPSPWQNRQVVSYDEVAPQLANGEAWQTLRSSLGPNARLMVDLKSSEAALVTGAPVPFIPGSGNGLTLRSLGRLSGTTPEAVTSELLAAVSGEFLAGQAAVLQVPLSELALRTASQVNDDVWVVIYQHRPGGVPVLGSRVTLVVGHGNLIQWGSENTFSLEDPSGAHISGQQALDSVRAYVGWNPARDGLEAGPELVYLPQDSGESTLRAGAPGRTHRLVWEVVFRRSGAVGTWLAHVDARTGAVAQFGDINQYAEIRGGIEPFTWTDAEVSRALPLVRLDGSTFSSIEGLYTFGGGTVTGDLDGEIVRILDQCGGSSFPSVDSDGSGNIDFGTGPANPAGAADCTTNGVGNSGGAHNTHAARSAYYHITRAKDKSSRWLPGNGWLDGSHDVRVNILDTCNAYWSPGGGFNGFFQEGFNSAIPAQCYNTGEIAGVFLHEFGHGFDQNDAQGTADGGTGEAYGDVIGMIELHDSCLGKRFWDMQCTGYGLPCTDCDSVRDADYAKHEDGIGNPVTTPFTPANYTGPQCPGAFFGSGPCNKEVHCEAYPGTGAIWDLAARKLNTGFPQPTAWYIVERDWLLATSIFTSMFNCNSVTFASDGCAATSWFQAMLAIDDDDGDLSNGTPHAAFLFDAFDDHAIACGASGDPENQNNSSCTALSTPLLSADYNGPNVDLSWNAVAGAAGYAVFKNHGDCSLSALPIATVATTTFTDTDVASFQAYGYRVLALGAAGGPEDNECYSNLSNCAVPNNLTPIFDDGFETGDTSLWTLDNP